MDFENLANRYGVLKKIGIVLLSVFLLAAFILGHQEMRFQNLRYLFRAVGKNENAPTFSYATGSGARFTLYKGDLAVCGDGLLTLYRPSGSIAFRENFVSSNLTIASGEKYMAVYAPDGNEIFIFDSFSCLHRKTVQGKIGLVSMSANGAFAVYSRSDTGGNVSVYDADFRLIYEWNSADRVVLDIALSDNGKSIAIFSLVSVDGTYFSELFVQNIKKNQTLVKETFYSQKPNAVGFFSNDNFYAASENVLTFYRSDGAKITSRPLSPRFFRCTSSQNTLVVMQTPTDAVLYQSDGEENTRLSCRENVLDLKINENIIAFRGDVSLSLYRTDGTPLGEAIPKNKILDYFVLSGGTILFCYPNETNIITLSSH